MKQKQTLTAIGAFIVLWGLLSVATSFARWKPNDYAFDFFPRWYGARQVLLEGESNPYSQEIEDEVQTYQQFDDPQANLPNFLYPAPIIYILSPFWLLPWQISINLWTGLALTLALVLPLAVYLILDWRIPPILLALLTFFFGVHLPLHHD